MNLSELSRHQRNWEVERGIDNGKHNIERVQEELDEAREAVEPLDTLEEMIDVVIVLSAGMAKIVEELGLEDDFIDKLLEAKLVTNSIKYRMEFFGTRGVDDAISAARHWWSVGEPWSGGDYY